MPEEKPPTIRGRGAADNPGNRFEKIHLGAEVDMETEAPEPGRPPTQFLKDHSKSILTRNNSPDVGFEVSVNPYRGCEHGCIYCYARPTHEYLGFSAGLDFETRIMVKEDAPELLLKELSSPKYELKPLALSGVTDPYQPVEKRLGLTRRVLAVLAEHLHPVFIVTKNALVTRDLDLLKRLADHQATAVLISVTSLDADLCARLEPRTSRPAARLKAIEQLTQAGVPAGVMVAPVIPGLTDHEMPAILGAAAAAGARWAGFVPVRLPFGVADLFEEWLERHFPDRKNKVMSRIRSMRGGKRNEAQFGKRMRGEGVFAEQLASMFRVTSRKAGFVLPFPQLSSAHFVRPAPPPKKSPEKTDGQLTLF